MKTITIASRESALAMWQAEFVRDRLHALYPEYTIKILGMTTQGDQILDKTLSKIGGKGLFVKELEAALLDNRADLAVHSLKDVPMLLPQGFELATICKRATVYDAWVSNQYASIEELPHGAVVGTSSLRREAQLRARFPHLEVKPLRGNVQTRLRKLDEEQYDAIILAAAGLERLNLTHRIRAYLSIDDSLPAAGQGALGIEIAAHRDDIKQLLKPLHHPETADCVIAERALACALGGSCQVPLAAFACLEDDQIHLRGLVASVDGSRILTAAARAPRDYAQSLGKAVAKQLCDQGAQEIINQVMAES